MWTHNTVLTIITMWIIQWSLNYRKYQSNKSVRVTFPWHIGASAALTSESLGNTDSHQKCILLIQTLCHQSISVSLMVRLHVFWDCSCPMTCTSSYKTLSHGCSYGAALSSPLQSSEGLACALALCVLADHFVQQLELHGASECSWVSLSQLYCWTAQ